jgi:virginiamycin B lyase
VAVDAAHVYWSSGGSIGRANLDGAGVDQSFITGARRSYGVAVDAAHLYRASRTSSAFNRVSRGNVPTGSIGRANLDGTGVDLSFITGAKDPCGVAVDATHVYWADWRKDLIGRAKLDGTDVDHRFITGASHPCWVAVDEAHVYWGHWGTENGLSGPRPARSDAPS